MASKSTPKRDGRESLASPESRDIRIVGTESTLVKHSGQPKQMGPRVPRSGKPPGPPPAKKTK